MALGGRSRCSCSVARPTKAAPRQPPRSEWVKQYAPGQSYHYNAIQAWDIDAAGKVTNAYT